MNNTINGRAHAQAIKNELKVEILKSGLTPGLAVILVGQNPASQIYVQNKKKACAEIGIESFSHELPEDTKEDKLIQLIEKLNQDEKVHGILVQLPLPEHINEQRVIEAISPTKDIDCFHPINVGRLYSGRTEFLPCTPAGIIEILKRENVEISGQECVVVGRSNIVGKPIAQLLLEANGTVTICHSRTKNLMVHTKRADILIVAVGKANFITANMVKPGSIIIDVGINRNYDNKLIGDVDFENIRDIAGKITPVPGGIGPMTIACLLQNTWRATKK